MQIREIDNVVDCTIIRRLNRFVVEISVMGRSATAYINNTGRLAEYIVNGRKGYCIENLHTKRTSHRLFAVDGDDSGAIVDIQMQMQFFEKAVGEDRIPWLSGGKLIKRNAKLGSSLIDYLFDCSGKDFYVEAKSAVLRGNERYAMYPDCPTIRGRRHIEEITSHVSKGGLVAIVFIAALPNVEAFKPNRRGDPEIPALLVRAHRARVIIKALSLHYDPKTSAVYLDDPDLKVELPTEIQQT